MTFDFYIHNIHPYNLCVFGFRSRSQNCIFYTGFLLSEKYTMCKPTLQKCKLTVNHLQKSVNSKTLNILYYNKLVKKFTKVYTLFIELLLIHLSKINFIKKSVKL